MRASAFTLLLCLAPPVYAERVVTPVQPRTSFSVEIVWGTSVQTVDRCIALGAWPGKQNMALSAQARGQVMACNAYYHDRSHCVIYAVTPEHVNDAATTVLGHELLHCSYGAYHAE